MENKSDRRTASFETGLGSIGRNRFDALVTIRAHTLAKYRDIFASLDYSEVTVSSLVNLAGSCENPYASFSLPYYGRQAHLSQSAQLQLEMLVIRLDRRVFTVSNSFREEHFDDPEAEGRRLSEFTLLEAERPFHAPNPEAVLEELQVELETVVKDVVSSLLHSCREQIELLGGELRYLESIISTPFERIEYQEGIDYLNREHSLGLKFGHNLGIREERLLLKWFNSRPVFVTMHPANIKFFNTKRAHDGRSTYSVDLLLPRLGETVGAAVREEHGEVIREQLLSSRVAEYAREKGFDPLTPFTEYFQLFSNEPKVVRGGYGIGFERFVAFLLSSNDILETLTPRTIQP